MSDYVGSRSLGTVAASALVVELNPSTVKTCFPEPFRIAEVDGSSSLGPVAGDGMSQIFLNYDDVRNLVSTLGKTRPTKDARPSFTVIEAALGMPAGMLLDRLIRDGAKQDFGVHLSWQKYCDLCLAMEATDLTAVRHTERLEVVAKCLGWRADALMHQLKTTTGKLGRNESLRGDSYNH